ncbi:unnamed protein product [Fraxinus pennsylvanica]|uniref:Uncharacterized protein n=1 Tax=Fraxinus pennsylvanica TaxID=56036 RepID=A0AAD1YTD2_9LAMI|nr:unnamed protein product [Fraxinus pennsylvanica]
MGAYSLANSVLVLVNSYKVIRDVIRDPASKDHRPTRLNMVRNYMRDNVPLSRFGVLVAQLESSVASAAHKPPDPLLYFDLLPDLVCAIDEEPKTRLGKRSKQRSGSGGLWAAEATEDSSCATSTPNLDKGTLSLM